MRGAVISSFEEILFLVTWIPLGTQKITVEYTGAVVPSLHFSSLPLSPTLSFKVIFFLRDFVSNYKLIEYNCFILQPM